MRRKYEALGALRQPQDVARAPAGRLPIEASGRAIAHDDVDLHGRCAVIPGNAGEAPERRYRIAAMRPACAKLTLRLAAITVADQEQALGRM
jgi:hypothetical protein